MTTIQHAPATPTRCGPTVHRADTAPNRRRGGEHLLLLSPGCRGATAGVTGPLNPEPREIVTEACAPYP